MMLFFLEKTTAAVILPVIKSSKKTAAIKIKLSLAELLSVF